jgi:hypothetical protein
VNCLTCQRELLLAEDPRQPAPAVAEHLASCAACRACQEQLLRLEARIARLPVPPAETRAAFLHRLVQGSEAAPPASTTASQLRRRRLWVPLTVGLAAALVFAFCLWLLGPRWQQLLGPAPGARGPVGAAHQQPAPEEPAAPLREPGAPASSQPLVPQPAPHPAPEDALLAQALACDLSLAEAETPAQTLETLATLADLLQGEAQRTAGDLQNLQLLARLYERVLQEGLVASARDLPATERPAILLPIAQRLERVQQDWQARAGQAPPASAPIFRQLAAAAAMGGRQLQELMTPEGRP